jgi:PDZ domain
MTITGGSTRYAARSGAVALITASLAIFAVSAAAVAADSGYGDASAGALYEPATSASPSASPVPSASRASSATSPLPAVSTTSTASESTLPAAGPSAAAPAVAASALSAAASPSATSSKTVLVPDSMPAPAYVTQHASPATTTVIPPALPLAQDAGGAQNSADSNQVANYEQEPPVPQQQLHSLQEFIDEGDETSPLGLEVHEDRRKLQSGEQAEGLLVVGVLDGSPAAKAGLHAYKQTAHDLLEGAAIAASLIFPPAVLAVPIFDQVHVGESYDLIIGVDGSRVTNFIDFEDRMRDVQPGEIVYLSVVRDGLRVQVPVHLPTTLPPPVF